MGKALAIMPHKMPLSAEGCVAHAVYMYSVEKSAVSEAASGMMFLSMNAR